MKKLTITLVVMSLILSTFVTAANAQTSKSTNQGKKTIITKTAVKTDSKQITGVAIQQMPTEVSGEVGEVSKDQMTVKGSDGKTYLVPLTGFLTVDGFKELGLVAGTKVTMKGPQAGVPGNISAGTFQTEGAVNQEPGIVTVAPEKSSGAVIVFSAGDGPVLKQFNPMDIKDGEVLFLAVEISANGRSVKLPNISLQVDSKNVIKSIQGDVMMPIPAEMSGTITEISEDLLKFTGTDGKTYLVPLGQFTKIDGFKELGLAKGINVTIKTLQPGKSNICTEAAAITKVDAALVEKAGVVMAFDDGNGPIVKQFELNAGEIPIIAEEITANGKTVSIQK